MTIQNNPIHTFVLVNENSATKLKGIKPQLYRPLSDH